MTAFGAMFLQMKFNVIKRNFRKKELVGQELLGNFRNLKIIMSRLNTSRNPLLQLAKLMPRPTMHADFLRSIRGSGVSQNNFVEV